MRLRNDGLSHRFVKAFFAFAVHRAQLIYALDFGYLKQETFSDLDELGQTATKCVGGLIRHLNVSSFRGRKFKQRDDLPDEPKSPENRGTPSS